MAIKSVGKFTILRQLGSGAHSTILHISRQEDGRQYALKVVPIESADDQKFLEQAEHEFRVARMLDHANLIKIYCLEKQTNWLMKVKKVQLLIEYVNGETLDKVPALAVKRLVPLFVQVAAGLVHMHRRNVLHADLKPGNIMVNRKTWHAKVIDYGLAWIKGESKGRIQGTPEYMAPETILNGFVTEKTDIFNFGATMYRLITFRLPPSLMPAPGSVRMNAKTYAQMLKPVAECNPLAPPVLCDVVHRCLEYNSDRRPERMSEVQGALDRLADELGPAEDDDEK